MTVQTPPPSMKARTQQALWRTKLCEHFETTGECPWGEGCWFAHGEQNLRSRAGTQRRARPTKEAAVPGEVVALPPMPATPAGVSEDLAGEWAAWAAATARVLAAQAVKSLAGGMRAEIEKEQQCRGCCCGRRCSVGQGQDTEAMGTDAQEGFVSAWPAGRGPAAAPQEREWGAETRSSWASYGGESPAWGPIQTRENHRRAGGVDYDNWSADVRARPAAGYNWAGELCAEPPGLTLKPRVVPVSRRFGGSSPWDTPEYGSSTPEFIPSSRSSSLEE
mmetsp:Transcript_858/g.2041  ORF Transcript_858/g.2041 Transcript_858/m.2041 type:complete len:277 (-) Transcript_858:88-918(-)